jgi:hypothetical protein
MVLSNRRGFPAYDVGGWLTGQPVLIFDHLMQKLRVMFLNALRLILCKLDHDIPDPVFGHHVSIFFLFLRLLKHNVPYFSWKRAAYITVGLFADLR